MPSMPDVPVTQREFEEFQTRLFAHLTRADARFEARENGQRDLVAAVHRLEERLSRIERRLDVLSPPDDTDLRNDLGEVRGRLDRLEHEVRDGASRDGG